MMEKLKIKSQKLKLSAKGLIFKLPFDFSLLNFNFLMEV